MERRKTKQKEYEKVIKMSLALDVVDGAEKSETYLVKRNRSASSQALKKQTLLTNFCLQRRVRQRDRGFCRHGQQTETTVCARRCGNEPGDRVQVHWHCNRRYKATLALFVK